MATQEEGKSTEEEREAEEPLVPRDVASYPHTAPLLPLWHDSYQDLGDVGELLLDLKETSLCVVAGANGNEDSSFMWLQVSLSNAIFRLRFAVVVLCGESKIHISFVARSQIFHGTF